MKLFKFSLTTCLLFIFVIANNNIYGQKKKKNKKSGEAPVELSLDSAKDSLSYSLGLLVASNLKAGGITSLNYEAYIKGLEDNFNDSLPMISEENASVFVNNFVMSLQKEKGKENLNKAEQFLEENKKKEGVVELPSGLQYEIIEEGEGESPGLTDKVTTHYKGMLLDGTVFDSSYDRGEPVQFPVNGVIKGWTEALQLMKPGAKWKLYIPPTLGYGENPPPGEIEPNSLLIFEIELISVDE
ncbi:MAG: FKBP-type peptidyl-prolyl cis-trans isomerase [bacterium]